MSQHAHCTTSIIYLANRDELVANEKRNQAGHSYHFHFGQDNSGFLKRKDHAVKD